MKKIIMTLVFVMMFSITCSASGADLLYRFTHNDHDVLIVGKITYIDDTKIKAEVAKTIVSTDYMNQIDKRVQLNPTNVTIDISNVKVMTKLNVDDYILASLDKTLIDYRIANGLYKVDSLDIRELKIVTEGEKSSDLIAIETFVNSNGVLNRFSFENDKIKFTDTNGEEIIVYEQSDESYAQTLELEDRTKLQQVLAKEYDDAMVVTIILTAGIMMVIILVKCRTKVDD